jgi:alkylation response protein AidB-like acyl-CoA dehydrogenase
MSQSSTPDRSLALDASVALEAMVNDQHPQKAAVADWAATELHDDTLVDRDLACEFWREGWMRCADQGIQGLVIDPEFGGQGLDLITALLRFEGLGLGCGDAGLVFGLSSQIWTMQSTLDRFGSEEQRATWLPRLVSGEAIGGFTISEPEAGSDAFSLTTTATPTDDGYVLNGTKAWVSLAPVADVFLVFATINPELKRWGVSTFLVPADTPGLEVGPNRPKMGMRTTPFANITFTDCAVPKDALVGNEGSGAPIFSSAMEFERAFLLAGAVGHLERQINQTVDYANERRQFDVPIGSFQAVSHQIAEMKRGHESARLLMYKAAVLQASGKASMLAAALAKLSASEAALEGAISSVRIHGARGYVSEYGVERSVRDTLGGVVYGGSSEVERNIVARLMGLPE